MGERILALDPGNSTGWCYSNGQGCYLGGTIGESLDDVYKLIQDFGGVTDVLVYETFQLYPSKAMKMMWNTFYPCEVIGVIRLCASRYGLRLEGLQPSVKKFAGVTDDWKKVSISGGKAATEHTRDAYKLLRFYERNKDKL